MHDATVVLSCDSKDGKIGNMSRQRVDKAIELFEAGMTRNILMTGSGQPNTSKIMKEYAVSRGISRDVIFVEPQAKDTIGNAVFSHNYARNSGWNDIAVVTNHYHMSRTKFIFKKLGIDATFYDADLEDRDRFKELIKMQLDRILLFMGFENHPAYWNSQFGRLLFWMVHKIL